jgi:hypothetical protein
VQLGAIAGGPEGQLAALLSNALVVELNLLAKEFELKEGLELVDGGGRASGQLQVGVDALERLLGDGLGGVSSAGFSGLILAGRLRFLREAQLGLLERGRDARRLVSGALSFEARPARSRGGLLEILTIALGVLLRGKLEGKDWVLRELGVHVLSE